MRQRERSGSLEAPQKKPRGETRDQRVLRRAERGRVFLHRRYRNRDHEPEMCFITKVTRKDRSKEIDMIFYRVGSPAGMLTKTSASFFVEQSFVRWVTDEEQSADEEESLAEGS